MPILHKSMMHLISFMAILVTLAMIEAEPSADPSGGLDCRRFVFAPQCRGATIKRTVIPSRDVEEFDLYEMPSDEQDRLMDEYREMSQSALPARMLNYLPMPGNHWPKKLLSVRFGGAHHHQN